VSQVAFKFVYVIDTPCTPLSVLAVDRPDSKSSRPHTEYKRILNGVTHGRSGERETVTNLGAHGIFIFRIPLNGKMYNRLFVFML
jgi:hypothetical protein